MNNNNLDQITMRSSKRKRERFNLKSVNDTSFGMGEIQPVLVREVVPNSKSVFSVGNIVRLAPMNAPTFGEIKLHHNMMFVGMSDLTDKFSAFLAKQPVAFGGGLVQIPNELPQVARRVLAAMMLVGSKCTCYFPEQTSSETAQEMNIRKWYYNINSDYSESRDPISKIITNYNSPSGYSTVWQRLHGVTSEADVFTDSDLWCENLGSKDPQGHWQTAFKNYSGAGVNLGRILGWSHSFWVPSANFSPYSFLCSGSPENPEFARQGIIASRFYNPVTMDLEDVTPDNADYIIHNTFRQGSGTSAAIFCFRLSDFGKRIRKILLACGYGVEFNDNSPVSLMRLFALYKAWFDAFGITLYQSWETTNCAKLLQYYDSDYKYEWTSTMIDAELDPLSADEVLRRQTFVSFFADLADMWFTEEQDFITAHIRSAAVSPNDNVPSMFADAPNSAGSGGMGLRVNSGNIANGEAPSVTGTYAGHAYIDNVLHSQLDSEILKRLYKVTNRNTIAGRRIAELLKAQGLGEYMKRCRSNFIGHWACEVDVFDVTATADSFNSVEDRNSVLGEFVGKGVGNGKSKRFSYTAPEFGFILDLAAMCPESGWTNGEDLSVRNIHKLDFYNPEYDGLGYELNPKSIVSSDVVSASIPAGTAITMSKQSFGFVPRYTRHKVARNVMNGDFSLRSTRASFLPYSLDKYVAVGDRVTKTIQQATNSSGQELLVMGKCLSPDRVPIASPMYRYLARYPWMGNLNRIFTNIGRDKLANVPFMYWGYDVNDGESVDAWYLLKTDDNFIVQNVFLYDYYAPMLAIEDSFETKEDGNNGGTDMAIGKA